MCMQLTFIILKDREHARFNVPGLHLHKPDIINMACNNVEDKHGRFSFTLVPDYEDKGQPNMYITGEEFGVVFNPNVLAAEILAEVIACEQRLLHGVHES